MNRPKIICHILQSVDGNIDGGFFAAPVFAPAFQAFGRVRAEYACDAVVSGATFEAGDYRSAMPQYAGEAFEKNRALLELVRALAEEKGATPAQISLAWMLGKKPYIVPIPGSRKVERIRENLGAAAIALTPDEVKAIDARLDGMEMSAVFGGSPVKKKSEWRKSNARCI